MGGSSGIWISIKQYSRHSANASERALHSAKRIWTMSSFCIFNSPRVNLLANHAKNHAECHPTRGAKVNKGSTNENSYQVYQQSFQFSSESNIVRNLGFPLGFPSLILRLRFSSPQQLRPALHMLRTWFHKSQSSARWIQSYHRGCYWYDW